MIVLRQWFNADERNLVTNTSKVEVRVHDHWYFAQLMGDGIHKDYLGRSYVNSTLRGGPHSGDYFRVYPGHVRHVVTR